MEEIKTKIIPYTIYKEIEKNGEVHHEPIENITRNESIYLEKHGYEPVMLMPVGDTGYYQLPELPTFFLGGSSIKGYLCYFYDCLTDTEKEYFKNKTVDIVLVKKEEKQEETKKNKRSRRRY